ncbi:uncharacterized protein LOC121863369 [Homarus americanus]|uniref:uncharacterized protein LOC121863369 n=2 Tax=Homarus americanus TaxID=6706 RepID=UPI001C4942B1|nr:uncharacterized protein LOC121863369 [Homarus americanus]
MPPPKLRKMVSNFGGPGRKRSCCKSFLKVLFSHVGLFILVAIYASVGAYLYINLETDNENKRRLAKKRVSMDVDDAINYIISFLWFKSEEITDAKEYNMMVRNTLERFTGFVVEKASDSNIQYDGDLNAWDQDWTYSKSLLFTVTSMAAIGER